MTQNSMKFLMATTILAGFAIFAIDAAQAKGPSFSGGSISGFSSMRMDFNRVGGPGRALSRHETRIVPLDVVKTTEKPKDTKNVGKNVSKKDTNVARVSNPKSSGGGKGKQDLGNGPHLHVPAALADAYRITGGELGDLSRFDEFAKRLGLGPLTVANPLFPNNDDSSFPFPWPKTDQESSDRNFLDGWLGYGGAPGGPDTRKTGQAAGDAWRTTSSGSTEEWTTWYREYNKGTGQTRDVYSTDTGIPGQREGRTTVVTTEANGTTTTERSQTFYDADGNVVSTHTERRVDIAQPVVITGDPDSEDTGDAGEEEEPSNEKDSQPVAEGSGRPSNNGGGWCSPTGGCLRPARNNGSPRIIPSETDGGGTVSAHRQSPSWATDPSEYGYTGAGGGGGGGYTGYTPQDEEDGDNGSPGNPALEALNAAL